MSSGNPEGATKTEGQLNTECPFEITDANIGTLMREALGVATANQPAQGAQLLLHQNYNLRASIATLVSPSAAELGISVAEASRGNDRFAAAISETFMQRLRARLQEMAKANEQE